MVSVAGLEQLRAQRGAWGTDYPLFVCPLTRTVARIASVGTATAAVLDILNAMRDDLRPLRATKPWLLASSTTSIHINRTNSMVGYILWAI